MRILGIDPSINHSGWAILETKKENTIIFLKGGVILNSVQKATHKKLSNIFISIRNILSSYGVDQVAMEKSFVNLNPASSLKLGYARGAIMSAIGERDITFYEYSPNYVKKTITGTGHAKKEQIVYILPSLIQNITNIHLLSQDQTDAIAVAYTCVASEQKT